MTSAEIRAEVFREVLWRTSYHCSHTGPWDEALDACRDCHRIATEVVDGLAAKGLLLTEVEHGAAIAGADEYPDDPTRWSVAFGGEQATKSFEHPIRRYVGAWQKETK
ncbi:hypothetical protein [Nocardia asiatica]|uniref:hypothetical protein n=1 Tax=Nocardia asiatica TaxID=209252 RepID=UPI0024539A00|nr:hypothetical protein [Nocardia asiatica]